MIYRWPLGRAEKKEGGGGDGLANEDGKLSRVSSHNGNRGQRENHANSIILITRQKDGEDRGTMMNKASNIILWGKGGG